MFGLILPWLLLLLVITIVVLLLRKKWKPSLFFAAVFIVVNWWAECIPFRLFETSAASRVGALRIISFNIDGSDGDPLEKARNIRAYLRKFPHDIVFIAEFNEQYPKSLDSLLNQDYKYTTYPNHLFFQYFFGQHPFLNSRRLISPNGEELGVYACSMVFQNDTIDLYGCHWASNNYDEHEVREGLENIDNHKGIARYIRNIQSASERRRIEAQAIVREMSKTSRLAIVMGDMNDVGGSPAIKILESAGLKDAWWEKGVGYGATIHRPLPYRIDHIMHTQGLKIERIKALDSNGVSDHNALYAEFSLIK